MVRTIFSKITRRAAAPVPEAQQPTPAPAMNDEAQSTDPSAIGRGLRIGRMKGGTGGKGGTTNNVPGGQLGQGGRGGHGGEALINHNEDARMMIDEFEGGTGGEGGGGAIAGDGGGGGKALVQGDEETLLPQHRLPGSDMAIEEFGAAFSLSKNIVEKLSGFAYETAGSLRFATKKELEEDGFKRGEINQVKHALDTWSSKGLVR